MDFINEHTCVLTIATPEATSGDIEAHVASLWGRVAARDQVQLEQFDRLLNVTLPSSAFDVILSGYVAVPQQMHSDKILACLAQALRPGGQLLAKEPLSPSGSADSRTTNLLLSGFVDINVTTDDGICHIHCKKPAYDVGAASTLSLKLKPKQATDVQSVWQISPDDFDDDLIENDDELLDEEDLKMASTAPNRDDCETSGGQRKACKNCTCGRAEREDAGESKVLTGPLPASSCGNCYLGDAFRCASCPYLGMPAFKPGEQVKLSNRQLKPDA